MVGKKKKNKRKNQINMKYNHKTLAPIIIRKFLGEILFM